MAISFDKALGIHQQALTLRVKRAEILSNNLANADTPGFKARDLDFRAMLKQQVDGALPMQQTSGKHLPSLQPFSLQQSSAMQTGSADLLYRIPGQPSLDGNTVDEQQELAAFVKNTMDFQASMRFLNGKFKSLSNAIKGEV